MHEKKGNCLGLEKALRKLIMKRSELGNIYVENKTKENLKSY